MHNFFCSCLFFVLIRKDENMMMDLQSNSTVIGKRIDNNFIVMKQGKADNMKKFPLMLQSQQSQHAKAGKQGKNSNDLLVDTDILKNFTNMKLRPFSAKNYLTKVSPAVNRPEQ